MAGNQEAFLPGVGERNPPLCPPRRMRLRRRAARRQDAGRRLDVGQPVGRRPAGGHGAVPLGQATQEVTTGGVAVGGRVKPGEDLCESVAAARKDEVLYVVQRIGGGIRLDRRPYQLRDPAPVNRVEQFEDAECHVPGRGRQFRVGVEGGAQHEIYPDDSEGIGINPDWLRVSRHNDMAHNPLVAAAAPTDGHLHEGHCGAEPVVVKDNARILPRVVIPDPAAQVSKQRISHDPPRYHREDAAVGTHYP